MTADKVNAGFSFLVNVYSEIINAIKMKKVLESRNKLLLKTIYWSLGPKGEWTDRNNRPETWKFFDGNLPYKWGMITLKDISAFLLYNFWEQIYFKTDEGSPDIKEQKKYWLADKVDNQ